MRLAWILCVGLSLPVSAQAGPVVFGSGVIDSVVDGGVVIGPGRMAGGLTADEVVVGATFDFTLDIETAFFELRIGGDPLLSLTGGFFRDASRRVGVSGMNTSNLPFIETFQLAFFLAPTLQDDMSRLLIETVCPTCTFPLSPSLGGRVLQAELRQVPEPVGLLGMALIALAGASGVGSRMRRS